MLHRYAFFVATALVALFAWRRGGTPERAAAAMFVAALAASAALRSHATSELRRLEPGVLAVDLLLLAGLILLALKADRRWPIWCAAWHANAVVGHLAKALWPDLYLPAYQIMLSLSSWPTIMLLAAGILRHRRRLRRNGVDPPWSKFSPDRREAT